jgi:hypothetical protein
MSHFAFAFAVDLRASLARVVDAHVPERVYIVVTGCDEYGSADQEEILGFGDRQVAQRVFEEAVRNSHLCKLSRGARTKGYARGACSDGSEYFSIREVSRRQFQDLLLNPALTHLLRVAVDKTIAEE